MILVSVPEVSQDATRRLGSVDQRPGMTAGSDDPVPVLLSPALRACSEFTGRVHCPSIALTGIFEVSPSEGVGQPVT